MSRVHQSVSLMQAAEASPVLAQLTRLAQESSARLKHIAPLIPHALRSTIAAGPIEGATWCLLVTNAASAAKLRQLAPDLLSSLNEQGYAVTTLRVKVQTSATYTRHA